MVRRFSRSKAAHRSSRMIRPDKKDLSSHFGLWVPFSLVLSVPKQCQRRCHRAQWFLCQISAIRSARALTTFDCTRNLAAANFASRPIGSAAENHSVVDSCGCLRFPATRVHILLRIHVVIRLLRVALL